MKSLKKVIAIAMLSALPAFAQVKIITVGDSIVASYTGGDSAKHGWGQMLPNYIDAQKGKSTNFARGGRTAEAFWKEGHWSKAVKTNPKIVFIQFGHNDSNDKATNVEEFEEYIQEYVKDCQELNAEVILVTPPRRYRWTGNSPSTDLGPFASAMKRVASKFKVPVVDLYTIWGNRMKSEGKANSRKYYVKTDNTHFNTKGATALAEIVAREAKRLSAKFQAVAK